MGSQQYKGIGSAALQGSLGLQSQLADIPGFGGLRLTQAQRLSDLESGGLTNMYQGAMKGFEGRQKSFANLQDLATKAYEGTAGAGNKVLGKRQEEAMSNFNKFREWLATDLKVTLAPATGPAYTQRIMSSTDPEQIVEEYRDLSHQSSG